MDERSTATRPASPDTEEALLLSIRVIRLAIVTSIVILTTATIGFLQVADVPTVPLVPLTGAVVIVDLAFLVFFTRRRKRALAEIRRAQGRVV